MQIYVPTPQALPASKPKIETEVEVEHVFRAGQQPFTILAASISREFKRFGADAVQLAVDSFVGGDFPYVEFRLEGCRHRSRERLTTKVCAGLGAYHDIRDGGVSPVVSVSGSADVWRGRVSNYFSIERAFTAPTFTYYHGESAVVLVKAKRLQVTTGVLSRSIQPICAKVSLQMRSFELYGTTGKGANSFGLIFSF